MDIAKFRTEKLLLKSLHKKNENIAKDLGEGTERSYYLLVMATMSINRLPLLESESIVASFEIPSTEFIRYVAQR